MASEFKVDKVTAAGATSDLELDAPGGRVKILKPEAGTVVQFQYMKYVHPSGSQWLSVADTTWRASPLTITCTPRFSDSMIFVEGNFGWDDGTSTPDGILLAIYRDGVNLHAGNSYDSGTFNYNSPASDNYNKPTVEVYTSAVSVAPTTFTIWVRNWSTATIRYLSHAGQSHMKLWEIAQ